MTGAQNHDAVERQLLTRTIHNEDALNYIPIPKSQLLTPKQALRITLGVALGILPIVPAIQYIFFMPFTTALMYYAGAAYLTLALAWSSLDPKTRNAAIRGHEIGKKPEKRLAITDRRTIYLSNSNTHQKLARRATIFLNQINAVEYSQRSTGYKIVDRTLSPENKRDNWYENNEVKSGRTKSPPEPSVTFSDILEAPCIAQPIEMLRGRK